MTSIEIRHSDENAFWGWPEADLETVDRDASLSKLTGQIRAEVERLYPGVVVSVATGYQDTSARFDGEPNSPEEECVRDAVGRVYGQMDWVVYK